ncbi:MAG: beta-lactamase family protein [Armatimonadetes bacterium]|nr:beta-lactamase family protein [Armatimonadota bacterium]HOM82899.1 serine hydrolase domain-containing protein [Armatimonadota bacterium]HOQ28862.1 serine hydrolase domain-containing protein [Armatimonadota bacterium]HPO73369.1 serine hydrolase domain-containing protein [Armatimonadota bacterium]
MDAKLFEEAASRARSYVTTGHLPCALLAVANRKRILFQRAFGAGGEEEPLLWECAFPLASITKSIVAVAIARLVERGTLDYTDPVARHLPEFVTAPWRERITLGDIFTHSTGLACISFTDFVERGESGEEGYNSLFAPDPVYEPGTRYQYATLTYQLLNAVIRRRLGVSMSRFLQENLYSACGMTHTAFNPVEPARAMPAVDHPADTPERLRRFGDLEPSGAGLWSTAPDLIRLAQALLTPGKLLTPEVYRRHTELRPSLPAVGGDGVSRRTWGWNREIRPEFTRQPESGFFHGGATGTLLWIDPDADLIFVFLTNRWGSGNEHCFITLDALYGAA